jgi:cob(I)alamin adenosyltransferase
MKIYTKRGDDGSTGLLFGGRVPKDHLAPEAYGALDEAVSALGMARAASPEGELADLIIRVQRELFVAGAELATGAENRDRLEPGVTRVTPEMAAALEPLIDDLQSRYEAPREFVIPGQTEVAAALDLGRAVVRRGERAAVAWARELEIDDTAVVVYLNRLSDLLYVIARWQEGDPLRLGIFRAAKSRGADAPEGEAAREERA